MTTSFSARESGIAWPVGQVETFRTDQIVSPEEQLVSPELIDAIEAIEPGNFLLDERFLPGISSLVRQAEFIEVADHGKTREASIHEVKFGQLLVDSADDGEHSLHVAIKPMDYTEEVAHVYSVGSYLATDNIPGIRTFKPLGIYTLESGQPAVITHYRHPVRSLDTILWNPTALQNPEMTAKALGRAATSLVTVHTKKWIYGDAHAKNFAWDITRPTRDTILNDLDETRPFPRVDGRIDVAEAKEAIDQDLQTFISSVFAPKDWGVELPPNYEAAVKQDFCLVYAGNHLAGRHAVQLPSYERLAEIVREQANYS